MNTCTKIMNSSMYTHCIQFLWARTNIHITLEHVYCNQGNNRVEYTVIDQSLASYAVEEALIFGYAHNPWGLVLNYYIIHMYMYKYDKCDVTHCNS